MAKGVSAKGFKMTQNRRDILTLLVEEGGTIKSAEGKATSLMHGLLEVESSMVSFNSTLRGMEDLGFITRNVEGKRNYAISITSLGRKQVDAEELPSQDKVTAAASVDSEEASATVDEVPAVEVAQPVASEDFDWDAEKDALPGEIDYDILLGVFLKAAIRGMEPSNNGELGYYKQQNELAVGKNQELEAKLEKLRAENATLVAQLDQLQKNMNVILAKADKKPARGTSPIRKLLSPEEQSMLDSLMKQIPTARG